MTPKRGDIWTLDTTAVIKVLVVSSTVYNEIPTEPTVIAVPILDGEPDAGFGVLIGDNQWAATGLISNIRKSRLRDFARNVGTGPLTDVNNMLFRILATPDH